MKRCYFILLITLLYAPLLQAQTISTICGSGEAGETGDGGPASVAKIYPGALAVDHAGNIYIVVGPARIRKISASGIITTIAGTGVSGYSGDGGPASAAEIDNFFGCLAVDDTGNVYFADMYNYCIRKIDTAGIITTIAGTPTFGGSDGDGGAATNARLALPDGLLIDKHGNLYFTEYAYNSSRVRKVSGGIITAFAGGGGAGDDGDGGPATNARLRQPGAMAMDEIGNIYVVAGARIRKIDTSGIITTVAGPVGPIYTGDGHPATNFSFVVPEGIAVDKLGNIFISSPYTIRYVDVNGLLWTYAGTDIAGYSGDNGPAILAQINEPLSIAMNSSGELYVSEFNGYRIRKITATTGVQNTARQNSEVSIYPNPCTGSFTISLPQSTGLKTINITDMAGRTMAIRHTTDSDPIEFILSLPPGPYIAQIITEQAVYRQKILVQ